MLAPVGDLGDLAAQALDREAELRAVEKLRGEVADVADWRKHLRNNQKQVMIGAAVAGFVLGGGIAAMTGVLSGRRRRRDYY